MTTLSTEEVLERMKELEEWMNVEMFSMREDEQWPPLLRYALDEDFLSDELYEAVVLNREYYIKKAFSYIISPRYKLYPKEIKYLWWTFTLCLVRRFYEEGSGRDPFSFYNIGEKWRADMVEEEHKRWLQTVRVWGTQYKEVKRVKRYNVEWIHTQCFVLKGYKNSEIFIVNELLWNSPELDDIRDTQWGDTDELIRVINNLEVSEEFLRRIEKEAQRKRLKDSGFPYIYSLWSHSRYEWLLGLKALVSDKEDIELAVEQKPEWSWLLKLAGCADYDIVRCARWIFYPEQGELYLHCLWPKKYGKKLEVVGKKSFSVCGAESVSGQFQRYLSFSEMRKKGEVLRPGDLFKLVVGDVSIPIERDTASPFLIFQADRPYQGGYKLLPMRFYYPGELWVIGSNEDKDLPLNLTFTHPDVTLQEIEQEDLGESLFKRKLTVTYPQRGEDLGEFELNYKNEKRSFISKRGVSADIQVENNELKTRIMSDNSWLPTVQGASPRLLNIPQMPD